ncbi:MAG: heme-binding protein [Stenotrophomonas maltophilia]
MYNKSILSLEQTQKAMQAMIQQATQEPDRPVAMAIVDDAGNLVSYAKMDKCRPNPQTFAIRKAYTSAMSGVNSADYAERLKSQGRTVSDFGNPNLVSAQGAAVILDPAGGAVLGAIGVSGLSSQEDEDLAKVGVQALGL